MLNLPSQRSVFVAFFGFIALAILAVFLGTKIVSMRSENTRLKADNATLTAQHEEITAQYAALLENPVSCQFGTDEAMSQRNAVWRTFNGDATVPDGNAKLIGTMLWMILSPDSSEEVRGAGMNDYQQRALLFFSEEDISVISKAFIQFDPKVISDALRRIAVAGRTAEDFVLSIVSDKDRMERLLSSNLPIPLETLPDGTTP